MICEGLSGESKLEVMKFLHLNDDNNLLHPTKIAELREYIINGMLNDYKFYNSIWVDEKVKVNQVFSNLIANKHSTPVNSINFKEAGSSRQINGFSTAKGFSKHAFEKLDQNYKVMLLSLSSYKVCW